MLIITPNIGLGLFVLRLALGVLFLAHGPQKLQDTNKAAKNMNVSAGTATLVGLLETLGAASLILGVWMQIGALFIIAVMIGAIYMKTQKWGKSFTGPNGYELDFIILAAALTVLLAAPQAYTLFG